MERVIVYSGLKTPDGTTIHSRHRHDFVTHLDSITGNTYFLDGGDNYIRCSTHPDQELITHYSDEPFEILRNFIFRTGYGKPGTADYGRFRVTFLKDMSDEHLQASLDYHGVTPGGQHWLFLLQEKLYQAEHEISIPETIN